MVKYASRRASIKPTIPLYTFVLLLDDERCFGKMEQDACPSSLSLQAVTGTKLQGFAALVREKPPMKMQNKPYISRW
jgi:hypothetical protein